ncbi:MAG: hypothetical protein IJ859_07470 [Synergistaceae bacterium]|nr:hypothetical protein [Synergistaceae bacterium]MBR2208630.1 hypothetical protein [Synergistaceae bacterium]
MKRFIFAFAFVMLIASSAFGASSSELKKMSTFVSNFTEIGMNNFDVDEISDSELAYFGIWHNWHNNFKTRIQRCPNKNCPYGSYVIDKKFVAESVEKFFDLEIEHQDASNNGGHYDGKRYYHFEGATGEAVQARVYKVQKRDGLVIMSGETYWPDNEEIEGKTFTAVAEPYNYGGKNTWAIISLEVDD